MTSLSTADYPGIIELLQAISEHFRSRRVYVSLPSLRVGPELRKLPCLTSSVRKAGLTMAPEVATDRLRTVIRKPIRNEDLMTGCAAAFEAGYRLVKFYFLISITRCLISLTSTSMFIGLGISLPPPLSVPHTPFYILLLALSILVLNWLH